MDAGGEQMGKAGGGHCRPMKVGVKKSKAS